MKKRLVSLVIGSCALSIIPAQAVANDIHGLIGVGYGFGGDKLFKAVYKSGESETIKANEGLSFYAGADYTISSDYFIRGTFGYKSDDINASNGEITFERLPLEVSFFRSYNHHRFGIGTTYQTNVQFDCSITNVCNNSVDFDDAVGWMAQYEYAFNPLRYGRFGLGVKYTDIDYKASSGEEFDGSGMDVNVTFTF